MICKSLFNQEILLNILQSFKRYLPKVKLLGNIILQRAYKHFPYFQSLDHYIFYTHFKFIKLCAHLFELF